MVKKSTTGKWRYKKIGTKLKENKSVLQLYNAWYYTLHAKKNFK